MRRSDRHASPPVALNAASSLPSAPVDGIAAEALNTCSAATSDAACGRDWPPLTAAALAADPLSDTAECVYFVLAPEQRLVKIGWTRNPSERLRQLRRWSPTPIEWSVGLAGGRELERELHGLFADARAHGEWFRVNPRLARLVLAALERLSPHFGVAA